jgi:DNA-binding NarL/FixJ family response regulator
LMRAREGAASIHMTMIPMSDDAPRRRFVMPKSRGGQGTRPLPQPITLPGATRILIADGHEVVRCGLRTILEARAGWTVVAEAGDGKAAVVQAIQVRPDVAIVDTALPFLGGIEVARQIRARCPDTEVMALGVNDSELLARDLLQAGARAFLLKSEPTHSVVAAVEALSRHKAYFTGAFAKTLLDTYLSPNEHAPESPLSPRERVVVQLIAEGHSNKDIGAILCLSIKTIETHRASAMRKLAITSMAGLVRYAVRNRIVEP